MRYDFDDVMAFHCPRWGELPSLALYMDQVVMVVAQALAPFSRGEEAIITPAMVNNYVKLKLVDAPEKKRYCKSQVTRLIVFTLLKRVLSIQETAALIDIMVEAYGPQQAYDLFCAEVEAKFRTAFGPVGAPLAALRAVTTAEELMQAALTTLISKEMVLQDIERRRLAPTPPPA